MAPLIPGELITQEGEIELNTGRPTTTISVSNKGDRPIQIGSHFHFYETNQALIFDRNKAIGKRLDIPAGTAIRFEPGDTREIRLVPFGGKKIICGFNGLINGSVH